MPCAIRMKQEPGVQVNMAAIPPARDEQNNKNWLHCSVCGNAPKFSDISHLLTHIGSKGHLHAFNHTEIRAINNADAAKTLEQYKDWEIEHGIKTLLAERLAAKDSKEASKKRKASAAHSRPRNSSGVPNAAALVKLENDGNGGFIYRAASAQLGMFAGTQPFSGMGQSVVDTLPMRMGIFGSHDSRESSVFGVQGTDSADSGVLMNDYVFQSSQLRLKGVTWPGMDIFDAASDEMRKTRNQRKDSSIIDKMRVSSEAIQSSEFVFNVNLEMQRERDVYDSPSPPPEESEDDDQPIHEPGPAVNKRRRSVRLQSATATATARNPRQAKRRNATAARNKRAPRSTHSQPSKKTANRATISPSDIGVTVQMGTGVPQPRPSVHGADALVTIDYGIDSDFGGFVNPMGHMSQMMPTDQMGQPQPGMGNSGRWISDLHSPLPARYNYSPSHTINPTLLTPPASAAEQDANRNDGRVPLMGLSTNQTMNGSPSPAPRILLRSLSYNGSMQAASPNQFFPGPGNFNGANQAQLFLGNPRAGGYGSFGSNSFYMRQPTAQSQEYQSGVEMDRNLPYGGIADSSYYADHTLDQSQQSGFQL